MSDLIKPLISAASDRELTKNEAEAAFQILFEGAATPAQIGGFLMALRTRGETVTEFAAAASVMRAKCNAVSAPADAMDIVGTGGDRSGTLNISTGSALTVAGCGVPVAKHGNRALSSKSGAIQFCGTGQCAAEKPLPSSTLSVEHRELSRTGPFKSRQDRSCSGAV